MANLNPTLWRTCKMLAGQTRIRLLRQLHRQPGPCVADLGKAVGIKRSDASQELRRIQSRGLLKSMRQGIPLVYRMEPDPKSPPPPPSSRPFAPASPPTRPNATPTSDPSPTASPTNAASPLSGLSRTAPSPSPLCPPSAPAPEPPSSIISEPWKTAAGSSSETVRFPSSYRPTPWPTRWSSCCNAPPPRPISQFPPLPIVCKQ